VGSDLQVEEEKINEANEKIKIQLFLYILYI
jgi:hypothetical protein